jgi:hypothetical protein
LGLVLLNVLVMMELVLLMLVHIDASLELVLLNVLLNVLMKMELVLLVHINASLELVLLDIVLDL